MDAIFNSSVTLLFWCNCEASKLIWIGFVAGSSERKLRDAVWGSEAVWAWL